MVAGIEHAGLFGLDRLGRALELGAMVRRVLIPSGEVVLAQRLLTRGVADHDGPPGLDIAPGGCPAGGLENAMQNLVGNRVGTKASHGAEGLHGLIEVYFCHGLSFPERLGRNPVLEFNSNFGKGYGQARNRASGITGGRLLPQSREMCPSGHASLPKRGARLGSRQGATRLGDGLP